MEKVGNKGELYSGFLRVKHIQNCTRIITLWRSQTRSLPPPKNLETKLYFSSYRTKTVACFFLFVSVFSEKFTFACSVGCWNRDYAEFRHCFQKLHNQEIPFLNPLFRFVIHRVYHPQTSMKRKKVLFSLTSQKTKNKKTPKSASDTKNSNSSWTDTCLD